MTSCTCAGNRCKRTKRKLPEQPGTATSPRKQRGPRRKEHRSGVKDTPPLPSRETSLNLFPNLSNGKSAAHITDACGADVALNLNVHLPLRPPRQPAPPSAAAASSSTPPGATRTAINSPACGGRGGARGYRGSKWRWKKIILKKLTTVLVKRSSFNLQKHKTLT